MTEARPIPGAAGDALVPPGAGGAQVCLLFSAEALRVTQGANLGDGLGGPQDVAPGDIYALRPGSHALRLRLAPPHEGAQGLQQVAPGSEVGHPGAAVRLEAEYTLMAQDGQRVEVLTLSVEGLGRLFLPFSPLAPKGDYALIEIRPAAPGRVLADLLCLSFARGTMITLADGRQSPIEALVPGTRVLTRDHGAQPLRWLGQARMKAAGSFAPVVIGAGRLGNSGDLVVGQHQRLFLYQRLRAAGAGTAEVLVQARHFVDGETVFLRETGYVDYFSLIFDRHEIVYAESIPVESLMVTEATVGRLPPDLAEDLRARFPALRHSPHFGTDAGRQLLDHILPASGAR